MSLFDSLEAREIFKELMLYLEDEPEEEIERIRQKRKILVEIDQMTEDRNVSFYIFYTIVRWFYNQAYPTEDIEKYVDLPSEYEINESREYYLENLMAIDYMEEKYKNIYQMFEDELQEFYEKDYNHLSSKEKMVLENRLRIGNSTKYKQKETGQVIKTKDVGRNDPCPCGSGKKYKKCCGR